MAQATYSLMLISLMVFIGSAAAVVKPRRDVSQLGYIYNAPENSFGLPSLKEESAEVAGEIKKVLEERIEEAKEIEKEIEKELESTLSHHPGVEYLPSVKREHDHGTHH